MNCLLRVLRLVGVNGTLVVFEKREWHILLRGIIDSWKICNYPYILWVSRWTSRWRAHRLGIVILAKIINQLPTSCFCVVRRMSIWIFLEWYPSKTRSISEILVGYETSYRMVQGCVSRQTQFYEFVLGNQGVPLSGSWEGTAEFCSRSGYTYVFSFSFSSLL